MVKIISGISQKQDWKNAAGWDKIHIYKAWKSNDGFPSSVIFVGSFVKVKWIISGVYLWETLTVCQILMVL